MRWVSLRNLRQDRILAQNILDERGRVLLAKGVRLTDTLVDRLRKLDIGSVCIEDKATDDIVLREFVRPETRGQVLDATYKTLTELADGNLGRYNRSSNYQKRLRPLLLDVVAQLKEVEGTGEHLGTVYLSDGELFHHSVNVTFFAMSLGLGLGLNEDDLIDLGLGTLLHDVGKLKVPDYILKKPGKLTADEFEMIKLHPSYGYDLLRGIDDLPVRSRLVALEHHERVDGSGYPRGLKNEEIHYFARIAGVADVYEALTANRVYRKGYLPHQAYELLLGAGGTQFDPAVIEAFVKTIAVYPVGMTLVLSTGERAVVVESRRRQTQRPLVRVLEDQQGNPMPVPWEIDLGKERTIAIVGCEI